MSRRHADSHPGLEVLERRSDQRFQRLGHQSVDGCGNLPVTHRHRFGLVRQLVRRDFEQVHHAHRRSIAVLRVERNVAHHRPAVDGDSADFVFRQDPRYGNE